MNNVFFADNGDERHHHQRHDRHHQHYHDSLQQDNQEQRRISAAAIPATPHTTSIIQKQEQRRTQQSLQGKQSSSRAYKTSKECPQRYYAIRKCQGLKAPAIFYCCDDCIHYVGNDEMEDPEFEVFEQLQKAVEYIEVRVLEDEDDEEEYDENEEILDDSEEEVNDDVHEGEEEEYGGNEHKDEEDDEVTDDKEIEMNMGGMAPLLNSLYTRASLPNLQHYTSPAPPSLHHKVYATQQQQGNNQQYTRRQKLSFSDTTTTTGNTTTPTSHRTHPSHRGNDVIPRPVGTNGAIIATAADTSIGCKRKIWTLNSLPMTEEQKKQEQRYFEQMINLFRESKALGNGYGWNGPLRKWIGRQRIEYATFKDGSPHTTMTAERLTRLVSLGFPLEAKKYVAWEKRAAEWLKFFTKHGKHPSNEVNPGLAHWVYHQKRKYVEHQAGKTNNLVDERLKKLKDWGFNFQVECQQLADAPPIRTWEERFEELVEYRKIHGNTLPHYAAPGLGRWANMQRCQYRKYLRGEKSKLTAEKVAKLHAIGFEFSTLSVLPPKPALEERRQREPERQRKEQLKKEKKERKEQLAKDKLQRVQRRKSEKERRAQERLEQEREKKEMQPREGKERQQKKERKRLEHERRENERREIGRKEVERIVRENKEREERHFETMLKAYQEAVAANKPMNSVPKLATWVTKQRRDYIAYKNNSLNAIMTADRVARLTAVGFIFEPRKPKSWDERAAQWLEYYTKHGKHPTRNNDTSLCSWVSEQKRKYRERREGKTNDLTDKRIEQLTLWQFAWGSRYNPEAKTWDERFEELLEYKKADGHSLPAATLKGLGIWVSTQRGQYRKYLKGEKNGLTRERAAKLRRIGFGVSASKSRRKRSKGDEKSVIDLNEEDSESELSEAADTDGESDEENELDDEGESDEEYESGDEAESDEENDSDDEEEESDDEEESVEEEAEVEEPKRKRGRTQHYDDDETDLFSFVL